MAGKSRYVPMEERAENRARWEREILRWGKSGQSLSAWAHQQGLSRDALEYWKRKLQDKPAQPITLIPVVAPAVSGATSASPAPITTVPKPTDPVPIELLLGTRRLVLPPGFDSDTLRRAIAVLETC
jgi:hypothetical protein